MGSWANLEGVTSGTVVDVAKCRTCDGRIIRTASSEVFQRLEDDAVTRNDPEGVKRHHMLAAMKTPVACRISDDRADLCQYDWTLAPWVSATSFYDQCLVSILNMYVC